MKPAKQYSETGWSFYQEREHVENLLYSRFNFFIVFYGMFVAAFITLLTGKKEFNEQFNETLVIVLVESGSLIMISMWLTLLKIHKTLKYILAILDDKYPSHYTSPCISKLMKSYFPSAGKIISIWIPLICILSMQIMLGLGIPTIRCFFCNPFIFTMTCFIIGILAIYLYYFLRVKDITNISIN